MKSDINRRLCKSNSKPNLTNCCKYQLIIHWIYVHIFNQFSIKFHGQISNHVRVHQYQWIHKQHSRVHSSYTHTHTHRYTQNPIDIYTNLTIIYYIKWNMWYLLTWQKITIIFANSSFVIYNSLNFEGLKNFVQIMKPPVHVDNLIYVYYLIM